MLAFNLTYFKYFFFKVQQLFLVARFLNGFRVELYVNTTLFLILDPSNILRGFFYI